MREIKFRAWDKKRKEIAELIKLDFEKWTDISGLATLKYKNGEIHHTPIDEIDLMQYIGKIETKNGKEIEAYEGDIAKFTDIFGFTEIGVIAYDERDKKFVFKIKEDEKEYLHDIDLAEDIEILGNIYENPELLEMEVENE